MHLSSGCCQHCKRGHLPRFAMKCCMHGFPDSGREATKNPEMCSCLPVSECEVASVDA